MRDQRGAATALVGALILAICMAMLAAAWLVGWIGSLHRARATADLSALAAAQSFQRGGDACQAGRQAARRNGGELLTCRTEGHPEQFRVSVVVHSPLRPAITGGPRWAKGTAIAGNLDVS